MRVYVVRHGKAEVDSDSGHDEDRCLKSRGERQARFLGTQFATATHPPEMILSSGLTRAEQTAQLMDEELGCGVVHEARLETGHAASAHLSAILDRAGEVGSIAVVGHNPTLCELIGVLAKGLGGSDASLRTGEAVVLEIDPEQPIGTAKVIATLRMEGPVSAC